MVRLYYNLKDIQDSINDITQPETFEEIEELQAQSSDLPLDIAFFRIYESPSKRGTFTLIDEIKPDPRTTYIETNSEFSVLNWFRLTYIDSKGNESEQSDPIMADNVEFVVDEMRKSLKDTNPMDPAFQDEEYNRKIKEAYRQLTGSEQATNMDDSTISIVQMLVMISCCYDLAYNDSKLYKIQLPEGVTIDKGERVRHYLDVARSLEKRFNTWQAKGILDDGQALGTPEVDVVSMTKDSYFKVSHNKIFRDMPYANTINPRPYGR